MCMVQKVFAVMFIGGNFGVNEVCQEVAQDAMADIKHMVWRQLGKSGISGGVLMEGRVAAKVVNFGVKAGVLIKGDKQFAGAGGNLAPVGGAGGAIVRGAIVKVVSNRIEVKAGAKGLNAHAAQKVPENDFAGGIDGNDSAAV